MSKNLIAELAYLPIVEEAHDDFEEITPRIHSKFFPIWLDQVEEHNQTPGGHVHFASIGDAGKFENDRQVSLDPNGLACQGRKWYLCFQTC